MTHRSSWPVSRANATAPASEATASRVIAPHLAHALSPIGLGAISDHIADALQIVRQGAVSAPGAMWFNALSASDAVAINDHLETALELCARIAVRRAMEDDEQRARNRTRLAGLLAAMLTLGAIVALGLSLVGCVPVAIGVRDVLWNGDAPRVHWPTPHRHDRRVFHLDGETCPPTAQFLYVELAGNRYHEIRRVAWCRDTTTRAAR